VTADALATHSFLRDMSRDHLSAKRLQATRYRLITASSQTAGAFRLEEMP
jgi:hypothetical protein